MCTIFLALLIGCSLGIFLFDNRLILFNTLQPDTITVYTNTSNLVPWLVYSCFSFLGIALAILFLGILWARKKGRSIFEGLNRQALALSPLLALAFGRFLYLKFIKYIFFIPLHPFLIILAGAIVAYLNAVLHFDINIFSRGIQPGVQRITKYRHKYMTTALLLLLASLLAHWLTLSPFYNRFTDQKIFLGDEPKYLRMAYSLASDWDLNLTDDFVGDEKEVKELLHKAHENGMRRIGDLSIIGRDKGIYHLHMPGTSFLILPGFLADLKTFDRVIPNAQALQFLPYQLNYTRVLLFILAMGIFFFAARLFDRLFQSRVILTVLLLTLIFASPLPRYMLQIYPEVPAAFFTLLALNALLFPFKRKWLNSVSFIIGIGFLPWLHQRFIPLVAGLFAIFLYQEIIQERNWKKALFITLACGVVSLPYFYYFYAITGNPLPTSMYSLWGTSYTRPAMFPSGFFGYLFDTSTGMIFLFPWVILALAGIYWGLKLDRKRILRLLALFLPYFCLISMTPWHGIVEETRRIAAVLFPLFLIFLGYAIRAFIRRPSYRHLFFYLACLVVIFLNKEYHFWEIRLGNVLILPFQAPQIIQCFFVLAFFYLAIFGLDKWKEKETFLFPVQKISSSLRRLSSRMKAVLSSKVLVTSFCVLGIFIHCSYVLVFINNWNDQALAMSVFASLDKVNRSPGVLLHRKGEPSTALQKKDKDFIDIFKRVKSFELLPGEKEKSIPLGNPLFYEMLSIGCYRADLEVKGLPPDFKILMLDFMREVRKIQFTPVSDKDIASTVYLVLKNTCISPEMRILSDTPFTKRVKGTLTFYPVPSLVFGKTLMARLVEGLYPDCIQEVGPNSYVLSFFANSGKDNQTFKFQLYFLEHSNEVAGKNELLLTSYSKEFFDRGRYRVDIAFELPQGISRHKYYIALKVSDGRDRLLKGQSIWLKTAEKYWIIGRIP